ncbi:GDP-Man:Man(3)GlcNAc(2)-PP-Dol alpha-1,2-mannosyltransferase-like [Pollicipes pollicipes]|uniref:GDP-Man:Man(3)GlcNAc(2)-PP-Dol alpha-1,2-mannosyltransferase-like n=1 Tax=Pollicipes pollicipes TaxID=41117 RepID=UPI00188500D6|nr:GDP-Man:Man(3)GlcNAc(2)-PP-Dol alpha-1,2-mannosyltransferase-like [Pollicipes pollicipes]XP_037087058.1 GDP-Man:Man(3)GlcNAc(2)-PP-Dol alpha-1,2-mannosyltransferase-like [Pollicipes pollicipes]XP_037087059.1 GDP-Man:Man(3)GlcNAc(2)-PP-Dol alpha-1,2-mannosyltransferase-like [Pollicipes pollicipes]
MLTLQVIIWVLALSILPFVCTIWLLRKVLRRRRPPLAPPGRHVAFFHPYCNAGGGGERVLWTAICALAERYPHHALTVYTGDAEPDDVIVQRALTRFGLHLPPAVRFVRLRSRWLLEPTLYPVLTLLGQALGSVLVGLEALLRFLPDVYIDSMGYGFTLPVFGALGGCRVACYVHYPTISDDMLQAVTSGQRAFNNRAQYARRASLRRLKLYYYRLFALAYRIVGRAAHVVLVNSSWTRGHVEAVWRRPERVRTVYPPCDLGRLRQVPLAGPRTRSVLSVAQFRPEKDHMLQLLSFALLMKQYASEMTDLKLLLVGGCRDAGDKARVEALKESARELGILDQVEFHINVSFDELLELYGRALVGIHTMKNEHFGIGIVEMMAAGVVVVAHCSGGPLLDIVDTSEAGRTGYLAATEEQYARCVHQIVTADEHQLMGIRTRARQSCARFGQKPFEEGFLRGCQKLLEP